MAASSYGSCLCSAAFPATAPSRKASMAVAAASNLAESSGLSGTDKSECLSIALMITASPCGKAPTVVADNRRLELIAADRQRPHP